VAEGTPEEVAEVDASHTGRFLKEVLAGRSRFPAPPGEPAPRRTAAAKKPAKTVSSAATKRPRKKVAAAR
jgi:excinuclease ABC subunit A